LEGTALNYVKQLKRLNLPEMIGYAVKKHPRKVIGIASSVIIAIIIVSLIPQFIAISQKHIAKSYLDKSNQVLSEINQKTNETLALLENKKRIYKDYEIYLKDVQKEKTEYQAFSENLNALQKQYEQKDIQAVLSRFNQKKPQTNFLTQVKSNLNSFVGTYNDILEVDSLHASMLSDEEKFVAFKQSIVKTSGGIKEKLLQINQHAKSERIKNNAAQIIQSVENNQNTFDSEYQKLFKYTHSSEGTYNLDELRKLKTDQTNVAKIISQDIVLNRNFLSYWAELHEQNYTIVVDEYSDRSTENVSEPNPAYRQWTEQESYQDTETKYKTESYTERTYVGSRVVGNSKEDIYENQTKTKQVPYQVQVTKTRSVSKNNGQPLTIPVPYDVYKYYFTLEKHGANNTTEEDVYVGQKHEKYDSQIRVWNYKDTEEKGYVVWKQLWNDNEDIKRGKNINPKLEH
jgi:hypothetical protein